MSTTLQGSKELKTEVQRITLDLKRIADVAGSGFHEGQRVGAKLAIRIADGEAPRADKIGELATNLATLKAGLEALSSSLVVPTVDEFQALAETLDPDPE